MRERLEAAVTRANELKGTKLHVEQWNWEAGLDAVRHYAWGLGDRNPLYWDPNYAAGSAHGRVIAPPTFLATAFDAVACVGFEGFQPVQAGVDWIFKRPVRIGERLVADAVLGESRLLSGKQTPWFAVQEVDVVYSAMTTAGKEEVGRALGKTYQLPTRGAGGLSYEPRRPVWTEDQLMSIWSDVEAEHRTGAAPRLAARVKPGDTLPKVVKGPLSSVDMIAYYAGCIGSPGYKAAEIGWLYKKWAREAPENLPSNIATWYFSALSLPSVGHLVSDAGEAVGMPGAYANGLQMIGWAAHCLTNWGGDLSFLTRLDAQLLRPVVFGDVVWISGEVQSVDAETGSVDIAVEGHNQLEERVIRARARMLLPRYEEDNRGALTEPALAGAD